MRRHHDPDDPDPSDIDPKYHRRHEGMASMSAGRIAAAREWLLERIEIEGRTLPGSRMPGFERLTPAFCRAIESLPDLAPLDRLETEMRRVIEHAIGLHQPVGAR